jgi:hypothetical protein
MDVFLGTALAWAARDWTGLDVTGTNERLSVLVQRHVLTCSFHNFIIRE